MTPEPDGASFGDLFRAHYPRAVRLAYLHSGDRSGAEDAVAEAMCRVWVQWRAGRVDAVGPYLRRAVVNELRRSARRRALVQQLHDWRWGDLRGRQADTDAVADRDELLQALQRLPERRRLAVVLRYYEQLSEAETAAVMGISVGGVKSATSRGLDQLRALLGAQEVGP